MKQTKKCTNLLKPVPASAAFCQNALFLDIETTGFSPDRNHLYLIGAAWFAGSSQNASAAPDSGSTLVIEQFFAETPDSDEEASLLNCLQNLLDRFDTVITYNGALFDLPFLKGCAKRLGTDFSYEQKAQADLYRLAYSYRHVLRLHSYKQKTLEQFAGIGRKDTYSGGELIKLYKNYVKQSDKDEEQLRILLQHNYEDVLGMTGLLCLYAYDAFFQGGFVPVSCEQKPCQNLEKDAGLELFIACQLSEPLAAAISCHNSSCYLHAEKDRAFLRIPIFAGSLKYFYPDYKNYYYLPLEDTAVHKSVAAYVDKSCRQKAKAATCYTRREGLFLPQYEEVSGPVFYKEYKDSISYFEWKREYAEDKVLLKRYCMHMLNILKAGT